MPSKYELKSDVVEELYCSGGTRVINIEPLKAWSLELYHNKHSIRTWTMGIFFAKVRVLVKHLVVLI